MFEANEAQLFVVSDGALGMRRAKRVYALNATSDGAFGAEVTIVPLTDPLSA